MIFKRAFAISFLIVSMLAGFASGQDATTPTKWKRIPTCGFTFLLPSELKADPVRPIDSCLAAFSSTELSIHIDYGYYSRPLSKQDDMLDHSEKKIKIGGRDARLITYRRAGSQTKTDKDRITEIYIVTGKVPFFGEEGLLMSISSTEAVESKTLKRIYNSVRFPARRQGKGAAHRKR